MNRERDTFINNLMGKRGFTFALPDVIVYVFSMVLIVAGIIGVIVYFSSFGSQVSLHELDRKNNQLAENILSDCGLLHAPGVFSSSKLDGIGDPEIEPCFRYCELGSSIEIIDGVNKKTWKLGYAGETGFDVVYSSKVYPVGIYRENRIDDIEAFGFSEVIADDLPDSAEGYACATCSGEYNYECPSGYLRTSCEIEDTGSHGCCPTCAVVRVKCEKDATKNDVIDPGKMVVTIYDDITSRIACGIDNAYYSGEEIVTLPLGSETFTVKIYKEDKKVCVNLVNVIMGAAPDVVYTEKTCRRLYYNSGASIPEFRFAWGKEGKIKIINGTTIRFEIVE